MSVLVADRSNTGCERQRGEEENSSCESEPPTGIEFYHFLRGRILQGELNFGYGKFMKPTGYPDEISKRQIVYKSEMQK